MKTTRKIILMSAASALLLVGAGCGEGKVAIPASQYNSESALSGIPERVGGTPPIVQQQDAPADTADTAMQDEEEGMMEGGENNNDNGMSDDTTNKEKPPVPTSFPGVMSSDKLAGKSAHLKTTKGDITFEILGDEGPRAASNFIALTQSGYYDGLSFHRVVPGFVIQGGDPRGDGTGGPGYKFEDDKVSLSYDAGIVAMANAGPNTNGSQFFIMLEDNQLPPNYSIFGRVTSGMDVVRQIEIGDLMDKIEIVPTE